MIATHEIKVPFHHWSQGERDGWLPGCEKDVNDDNELTYAADDWGHMVITEIQRVSIPGFEDRVFYIRQWRDPEGAEFGKRDLRCKGARAFKQMLKGWRHPFYLDGELVNTKDAP